MGGKLLFSVATVSPPGGATAPHSGAYLGSLVLRELAKIGHFDRFLTEGVKMF
jgi:hypothetical protein